MNMNITIELQFFEFRSKSILLLRNIFQYRQNVKQKKIVHFFDHLNHYSSLHAVESLKSVVRSITDYFRKYNGRIINDIYIEEIDAKKNDNLPFK